MSDSVNDRMSKLELDAIYKILTHCHYPDFILYVKLDCSSHSYIVCAADILSKKIIKLRISKGMVYQTMSEIEKNNER